MPWEFRGAPCALWGFPGRVWGGSVERSGVECRGRVGCAARPLEKPERAWRRRSRVSQLDLVVLPLFPRLLTSSPCPPGGEAWRHLHPEPQTLESRFSGSAPSGRVYWGGGNWKAPGASRWSRADGLVRAASGWRGAVCVLCSRKVWVSCRSKVFIYSKTLLIATLEVVPQRPPPNSVGDLGALQLLSAAPLGARRARRLRWRPEIAATPLPPGADSLPRNRRLLTVASRTFLFTKFA